MFISFQYLFISFFPSCPCPSGMFFFRKLQSQPFFPSSVEELSLQKFASAESQPTLRVLPSHKFPSSFSFTHLSLLLPNILNLFPGLPIPSYQSPPPPRFLLTTFLYPQTFLPSCVRPLPSPTVPVTLPPFFISLPPSLTLNTSFLPSNFPPNLLFACPTNGIYIPRSFIAFTRTQKHTQTLIQEIQTTFPNGYKEES